MEISHAPPNPGRTTRGGTRTAIQPAVTRTCHPCGLTTHAISLILLLVWLVMPTAAQVPGLAAENKNGKEGDEETIAPESEVQPYSLAEAPERLGDHRQILGATLQLVEDSSVASRVESKLASISSDQRAMRREMVQIDNLPAVQLRALRDRSRYNNRRLADFQRLVNRRLASLEEQRVSINETLARWATTEETLGEEDLPQALAEDLVIYRSEANQVLERIRGAIDGSLVLQGRCQTIIRGFERIIERVDQASARQLRNIFVAEQSPLWRGAAFHAGPPGVANISDQWRNRLAEVRNFVSEFRTNLIFHGLATLATVVLLVHFRHRLHQSADAPRMANGVASMVERPFSSATLLMLLGIAWYYPYVPPSINYLGSALVCLPLLRLLPQLVPKATRAAIVVFIVLGLIDSLAMAALGATFAGRLLQASLMLPMAAVVGWGGRAAIIAARTSRPGTATLIGVVIWSVAAVFVGCALASLFGFLRLATAFYNIAFTAILSGLLYFALIKVLSGGLVMMLQSRFAKMFASVQQNRMRLLRTGLKLIRTAGVVAWLATVLAEAGVLPAFLKGIAVAMAFSFGIGNIEITIGRVLAFALSMWLALFLARIITTLLDTDMLPRMDLGRGVASAISKLVQYIIISLGALFAMAAAGIELQNLALLATAFSLGLGFGLQNLVNNFVSGLILIFERPVQFGDVVEVSGRTGEVKRIGIRSSTVRLADGAELVVPNGNLISNDLVNWTLSDRSRRIEMDLGVAYGSDLRRTKSILEACAREHKDIADAPPPTALFMGFGESWLNFSLRCWTNHSSRTAAARSELGINIYDALAEAGIEIPFPQRDLNVRTLPLAAAAPALATETFDSAPASAAIHPREPGTP
jgi:potassium efflux system protein